MVYSLFEAKKAISALYKHQANKANNDLLEDETDSSISIQISTHAINKHKPKAKPKKITLKHSPYPSNIEICLITKSNPTEIEALIKKQNVPFIKKVITPLMLKTTYKTYESKRKLAASYDLFLADDRISHLVPELFGKSFLARNKIPIPVKMNGSLKNTVEKTLKCTFAKVNAGTVTSIKIGNFGMKQSEILENYEAAVPQLVEHIAVEWKNVNIIGLKSNGSPLLPIICILPEGKEEAEKKEETKEESKEDEKESEKKKKKVEKKTAEVKKIQKKVGKKNAQKKKGGKK
ncbi:ribosomal protein L1 [Rhizopus microsporus ATCC 52813]|uniref:Ribosomal protein L1 n=1 Tax=Rhizopus microsporus ATCC 52813 TaxID=1340429 RepID=A0A2G4T929_RHIZD|nr:ribosomal protein L1 [Rhizopus microsporus ATCC 52813]PHZ17511.1 ribosomal protein L1 [Rhizopus microsporus ATCC 52813]